MNRKLFIVLAIAIFLASCGKSSPASYISADEAASQLAESLDIELNPPLVSIVPSANYDLYLASVRKKSPVAESMTDTSLSEVGDLVCESFYAGLSMGIVLTILENATNKDTDLGASILIAAINYICPEYTADINTSIAP